MAHHGQAVIGGMIAMAAYSLLALIIVASSWHAAAIIARNAAAFNDYADATSYCSLSGMARIIPSGTLALGGADGSAQRVTVGNYSVDCPQALASDGFSVTISSDQTVKG
jgi:hypothetical protein